MATADRLIESTQELLWERGYVGTSPKAIQQRAGAGQGSMYHHFTGKPDLALAAVDRSAAEMRVEGDKEFDRPGTALDRITAFLRRDRDVLRGCRIGRLAYDPEVVASEQLRHPLADTFGWLTRRFTEIFAQGQADGEFDPALDPAEIGATLAATLQGGYVLARSANSVEPFHRAINGALRLLAATAPDHH